MGLGLGFGVWGFGFRLWGLGFQRRMACECCCVLQAKAKQALIHLDAAWDEYIQQAETRRRKLKDDIMTAVKVCMYVL